MIAKEVLQRLGMGGARGGFRTSDGWEDNSLSLIIDNICTAFKEEILSFDQISFDACSIGRSKFLNGGKEEMF